MKKFISAFLLLLASTVMANAMSYEQARQQALFLTDKMAYELNLNEAQYEAAYEINLDYLMNIMTPDDLYGIYWTRRNLDLSYILFDWQYSAYCAAHYFYRPLYWDAGYWHFGIYARYPHRDYFYFGRPAFVNVYRGGHSWHNNGNRSWYSGRDFGHKASRDHFGMRDGFQKGNYGRGQNITFGGARNNNVQRNGALGGGTRSNGVRNATTFGGQRSGSAVGNRSNGTVNRNSSTGFRFGGSRSNGASSSTAKPSNTFTPRSSGSTKSTVGTTKSGTSSSTFGGSRIGNSRNSSIGNSRGLLNNNRSSGSTTSVNRRNSFSGSRNNSSSSVSTSRSSVGSRSSSASFGGSRSTSVSRSSSSSKRSVGSGSGSSGSKFGGRR